MEIQAPDNFMSGRKQLSRKQESLKDEEEFKDALDHDFRQSSSIIPSALKLSGNVIMGYGNIPVTYKLYQRDCLPYLVPPGQTFSIWSILKSAVGKDLSKITMPI